MALAVATAAPRNAKKPEATTHADSSTSNGTPRTPCAISNPASGNSANAASSMTTRANMRPTGHPRTRLRPRTSAPRAISRHGVGASAGVHRSGKNHR